MYIIHIYTLYKYKKNNVNTNQPSPTMKNNSIDTVLW